MLFYKNGKWHVCSEKVRYAQHGEEIEQYVGGEDKQWWLDFEEKWEHTEIIEFIPVKPTEKQLMRYNEVTQLNLPDGFGTELSNYVEFGTFPTGFNHVLRPLEILKQQEEQDRYLVELDFRQSLSEMGVNYSDL